MHSGTPCLVGEGKSEGVQGARQGDPTFFHFCTLVRRKNCSHLCLLEEGSGGGEFKPPSSQGDADREKKKQKKKDRSRLRLIDRVDEE